MAVFSDIEYFGIAEDRDIVFSRSTRSRRNSELSTASSISLPSLGISDEFLKSALPQFGRSSEAPVLPLSPLLSSVASELDLTPEDHYLEPNDYQLPTVQHGHHGYGPGTPPFLDDILPIISTWMTDPSDMLPMDRYMEDFQRHEQTAVFTSLGIQWHSLEEPDHHADFQRSLSPSPSTNRATSRGGAHNLFDVPDRSWGDMFNEMWPGPASIHEEGGAVVVSRSPEPSAGGYRLEQSSPSDQVPRTSSPIAIAAAADTVPAADATMRLEHSLDNVIPGQMRSELIPATPQKRRREDDLDDEAAEEDVVQKIAEAREISSRIKGIGALTEGRQRLHRPLQKRRRSADRGTLSNHGLTQGVDNRKDGKSPSY